MPNNAGDQTPAIPSSPPVYPNSRLITDQQGTRPPSTAVPANSPSAGSSLAHQSRPAHLSTSTEPHQAPQPRGSEFAGPAAVASSRHKVPALTSSTPASASQHTPIPQLPSAPPQAAALPANEHAQPPAAKTAELMPSSLLAESGSTELQELQVTHERSHAVDQAIRLAAAASRLSQGADSASNSGGPC